MGEVVNWETVDMPLPGLQYKEKPRQSKRPQNEKLQNKLN